MAKCAIIYTILTLLPFLYSWAGWHYSNSLSLSLSLMRVETWKPKRKRVKKKRIKE